MNCELSEDYTERIQGSSGQMHKEIDTVLKIDLQAK